MFYPDDKSVEPFEVETYMNISDEEHRNSAEVVEIATTARPFPILRALFVRGGH